MSMDHDYARRKLTLLMRDLSNYSAGEFWREMSRIAGGATGRDHAEELERQHQAMATFVNETINVSFEGGSLDGAWIQERGEELALLEAVEYDPAVHHIDCEMTEPGETIYVRAAWLGTKSEG